MIRVGIVGIGGYGARLIQLLREAAAEMDVRLVAAADARLADLADKAAELESRGVALFDDAFEMFRQCRRRCEAVYLATSIPTHSVLTIAAATAGYHVHLEKPPAVTVQEMDQMIQVLEQNARLCLVGFQGVHSACMAFLRQRAAEGRLGRIKTLVCRAGAPRDRAYYARNSWAGRLRAHDTWVLDGPATNALSHQITNMLLLAGDGVRQYARPAAVRAELYAAGPVESHDTAAIEIHTIEGPRLYWLGSHCTRGAFGPVIDIEAEEARAVWHVGSEATITYADGSQETCPGDSGHREMIRNFVEAVAAGDGSCLRCTPADARQFVLALDGAHESSGRVHRIDAACCRRVDEGTDKARTVVEGLDELICAAAERRGLGGPAAFDRGGVPLFSQVTPKPPWAVATHPYRLAGYNFFTQRFTCD